MYGAVGPNHGRPTQVALVRYMRGEAGCMLASHSRHNVLPFIDTLSINQKGTQPELELKNPSYLNSLKIHTNFIVLGSSSVSQTHEKYYRLDTATLALRSPFV